MRIDDDVTTGGQRGGMACDASPGDGTTPIVWIPRAGPDPDALERLSAAFPKPKKPMGEAWFMGPTRRMFHELQGELDDAPPDVVFKALEELISGPTCFGPFDEWREWFHYLLPNLIEGSHAGVVWTSGLELLATAMFAHHPHAESPEPYADFRGDVLLTLGRVVTSPECWPSGQIDVDQCLGKSYLPGVQRWQWDQPSETLSCSMFLHLKYLEPSAIPKWLASAFAIESPHWRAQLLAWCVGAHPFLLGVINQPGEEPDDAWPGTGWWGSHWLKGNYGGDHSGEGADAVFLPPQQRSAALSALREIAYGAPLDDWRQSFDVDPVLADEIGDVPELFERLYRDPA